MATNDIASLRARVQALGHKLIEDDWSEGDRSERAAPGLYVLDPKTDTLVLTFPAGDSSDSRAEALREIDDWCAGLETAERDRQTARGFIPAEGTTDGENGLYHEATPKERREAIVRLGDLSKAVTVAMGSIYAIHGMGRLLQQDTLRDQEEFVLSIAHMIVEESERLVEFLDRPGGWSSEQGGAS